MGTVWNTMLRDFEPDTEAKKLLDLAVPKSTQEEEDRLLRDAHGFDDHSFKKGPTKAEKSMKRRKKKGEQDAQGSGCSCA